MLDDERCVSGYLSRLQLINKAKVKSGIILNNLRANDNQIRIIPALRFTCNGTIVGAYFAAEPNGTPFAPTSSAELQVWYNTPAFPWFYNKRGKASLQGAVTTSDLNVYRKSFSQPLTFVAGDILGMYLPASGFSQLNMYFLSGALTSGDLPSYNIRQSNIFKFFNTNNPSTEMDLDVPLLDLEIGK